MARARAASHGGVVVRGRVWLAGLSERVASHGGAASHGGTVAVGRLDRPEGGVVASGCSRFADAIMVVGGYVGPAGGSMVAG